MSNRTRIHPVRTSFCVRVRATPPVLPLECEAFLTWSTPGAARSTFDQQSVPPVSRLPFSKAHPVDSKQMIYGSLRLRCEFVLWVSGLFRLTLQCAFLKNGGHARLLNAVLPPSRYLAECSFVHHLSSALHVSESRDPLLCTHVKLHIAISLQRLLRKLWNYA